MPESGFEIPGAPRPIALIRFIGICAFSDDELIDFRRLLITVWTPFSA